MLLQRDFYLQDTIEVAIQLLGKRLVHQLPNGQKLSGIIVETEAYLGTEDPGAHSFGGKKTNRTAAMFLAGGHSYVYLIYGMYNCFNVVTGKAGTPEAVLIRALEPETHLSLMHKIRKTDDPLKLTSGPGRLCQALSIDRSHSELDLTASSLWIEDGGIYIQSHELASSERIGIPYAGDAAYWPLRFYLANNPHISHR